IGPLIAQLIIKLSGTYVPVEVSPAFPDGLKLVYPYELFLGAAVVAAFTLIPAYFVAKNDKKIRAKLIGERDAALALNVAENAVLAESDVENANNLAENGKESSNESGKENAVVAENDVENAVIAESNVENAVLKASVDVEKADKLEEKEALDSGNKR
ncbi:MAG: hypothetical protein RR405_05880, partial [Clostridia bacterium]